jgi:hypothetical protein
VHPVHSLPIQVQQPAQHAQRVPLGHKLAQSLSSHAHSVKRYRAVGIPLLHGLVLVAPNAH